METLEQVLEHLKNMKEKSNVVVNEEVMIPKMSTTPKRPPSIWKMIEKEDDLPF